MLCFYDFTFGKESCKEEAGWNGKEQEWRGLELCIGLMTCINIQIIDCYDGIKEL